MLTICLPRPTTEFYFDRFNTPHSKLQEFGNTERLATSTLLRDQHKLHHTKQEKLFHKVEVGVL